MIEVKGNLWSYLPDATVRVITTNGSLKKNGENVMGAGCAYEAARQFPSLPEQLGKRFKKKGNIVQMFSPDTFGTDYILITFPTKNEWHENADPDLIFKSACLLADLADFMSWKSIVMPRPGCGKGNLSWKRDVKPILHRLLDDRFYVISHAN